VQNVNRLSEFPHQRWTHNRKLNVIRDVEKATSFAEQVEILERNRCSGEELRLWQTQFNQHGIEGLKVSRRHHAA